MHLAHAAACEYGKKQRPGTLSALRPAEKSAAANGKKRCIKRGKVLPLSGKRTAGSDFFCLQSEKKHVLLSK